MSLCGGTMSSRCRVGCDSVDDGGAAATAAVAAVAADVVDDGRNRAAGSQASGSGRGFGGAQVRRLWTVCVRVMAESFRRRWATRPRDAEAVSQLAWRNLASMVAVLASGIVMGESSTPELWLHLGDSIVFPLYLPHAVSLAAAAIWSVGVAPGNLTGLYLVRVYIAARGVRLTTSTGLVFLLVSVLATVQSHVAGYHLRERLCRQSGKKYPTIDTLADAAWYLIIVTPTTLVISTLMALCLTITPLTRGKQFWELWSTWWLGILAAMLTVTPLVVHLKAWKLSGDWKRPTRWLEVLVTAGITAALSISVFFLDLQQFRPMPYLCFPLIVYTALRFNRVGWSVAVSAVAFLCAMGTIRQKGAFFALTGHPGLWNVQPLLQIQLFSIVMGMVSIALAAAVRENKSLTHRLHQMNRDLEYTVAFRTQQLLLTNEELQISQKEAEMANHAKSEFLANMSHEIRTPIHGILGLTALLLESELTEDQKESLVSVKECADLLLHIINSVLDLAKIEAGRLEVETVPFNLRKMVSSTTRMMQARAHARGLELFWEVDRAVPPSLAGDVGKLQQCLINLVGNALKFTHEGSVSVHARVASDALIATRMNPALRGSRARSARMSVDTMLDDESSSAAWAESLIIHFEVRDTGIGIDPDKLKDMFQPFAQAEASTSRLYGGTGLGLSIVHRFVEVLGGTIWVESAAGKGSAFHFCSPLFVSRSKPASAEPSPDARAAPLAPNPWTPYQMPAPPPEHCRNASGAHECVISVDDLSSASHPRTRSIDEDPSRNPDCDAFTEMRDARLSGATEPRPSGIELVEAGAARARECDREGDGDGGATDLHSRPIVEDVGDDPSSSPSSTAACAEADGDEPVRGTPSQARGAPERGRDPARDSSAAALERSMLQTKPALNILLVEDNPINQKVASRQLQKHGHVVTVVGDGQQALDIVCARHDEFDLVLMDVQMPVMGGLVATERIRVVEAEKGWARVPILGLTAHAIQGYQNTCLVHGMDGYLGKPFDIHQLLKTMSRLLCHRESYCLRLTD